MCVMYAFAIILQVACTDILLYACGVIYITLDMKCYVVQSIIQFQNYMILQLGNDRDQVMNNSYTARHKDASSPD